MQPYVLGSASLVTVTVPNYLGGSDVISSSFGYGLGAGISWSFDVFENFEISNEIAWTNTATTLTLLGHIYITDLDYITFLDFNIHKPPSMKCSVEVFHVPS